MSGSGLDDPDQARHAWGRYRELLAWTIALAGICVAAALWWLRARYGALEWATVIACMLGIGGTVTMAGALMGLVFLSSGTGHDEQVEDFDGHEKGRPRIRRDRP